MVNLEERTLTIKFAGGTSDVGWGTGARGAREVTEIRCFWKETRQRVSVSFSEAPLRALRGK